ncbi:hypothetical protein SAMN06297144_2127 [Sphingomonas guangdongensis]|uniref:DOMON-like domain-containing protein n=1 Tax=Sphingomonas guangdongensis TaxID=1141890 RepID=A0A285R3S6_9SPHN|nr:DOMON-like domain-containing protein [Sphingomonas guangdongensis]SOB87007.1 hypothetical protein SAMN06297144_2127 [Sphingomonas guangdongensis]
MLRQAQGERTWGLHALVRHPDTPSSKVEGVSVQLLSADASSMMIEFSVRGRSHVLVPEPAAPIRNDGLWKTTCFEAFLQPDHAASYLELNFSPSLAWAAYSFAEYRAGMSDIEPRFAPEIWLSQSDPDLDYLFLSAEFDVADALNGPFRLGLSAVIEEVDGTKSYWALAHPPGAPDFHHPDCFALHIPALGSP